MTRISGTTDQGRPDNARTLTALRSRESSVDCVGPRRQLHQYSVVVEVTTEMVKMGFGEHVGRL